ncbi:MAG: tRNA pseudouridine(55) synthase TruB [Clostridia bacterium]|nr:tRNA pseudouridine(55) synthase TruB [Clostridia bacterium]
MVNGIINIYKEKGFTSFDVVAKMRGILRTKKIGHTGTLDPDAEGVLPVCIGKATKVVEYLTDYDKTYVAEVKLGVTTTTEDASGEVVLTRDVVYDEEKIEEVVNSFKGKYSQTPPMYSALKVNGRRLYEYAREGKVIERKSRDVFINDIKILEFNKENESFKIEVSCSKGTYIRTLCYDIGEKLECGAHMATLLRTKVGKFELKDAIKLSELEIIVKEARLENVFQKTESVLLFDKVTFGKEYTKLLENGNKILVDDSYTKDKYLVYMNDGRFVGVFKVMKKEEGIYLKPEKMFL